MKLHGQFDTKLIEKEIRKHMELIQFSDFIKYELDNRDNQEIVGYIDGPPTMNGEPHVGHLRGRIIKDLWFRYNTLKQKKVVFRPGWDTQGLPVELQAEKELGLTGNKTDNINKVGIEKIVDTCKSIVRKYNEKWVYVDKLLNMSFDYGKEYWTFHDEYIEREWSYLKKAWESGILQEGFRVVAFCPSCQTSLSNAEVNQGYTVVEDHSFYYKVKLVDDDNVYLIVWTTMPFTLITDELIGVNPEENYLYVSTNNEIWIVGQTRLTDLMNELHIDNYQVVKTIKGKNLDGKYYLHPLLDFIPALKDLAISKLIHFVVAEGFVDTTTGSGIVHLSPANGEEDFNIAKKHNIPIFVPIDDRVIFTEEAGDFQGLFVRDSDQQIINIMNKTKSTVKVGKIKHQYPTCWRSHHKLVWLARREYFYMIDQLDDKPLEAASKVNYFFEPPKNRFIEIIKEQVPWCISRERIWGTPLPIWVCTNCGRKDLISNKIELVKQSTNLYLNNDNKITFQFKKNTEFTNSSSFNNSDHFELHRPWIDKVNIKCSECHSTMIREPFVLDTWHNSGAAPFASLTDTEYNKLIPASFLTEGIDQTRGWSYSLLMQNVILNQNSIAPFKSFLFQGHVLDEKGNKMSKSAGNVIDATLLLENNSVDLVRLYFMWKSSPIEELNFNLKEISSRPYQILSTLYYLHIYLLQNSELDNFNRNIHTIDWAKKNNLLHVPEKWILSLLQNLILQVNSSFENCRFHEGIKKIEDFIINDISQTYIPLTRNYIWNDSSDEIERRLTIFTVLDHILEKIDILLHPVSPFLTEYLYLNCFINNNKSKKDEPQSSILLCCWPNAEKNMITRDLEVEFEKMKQVISLANSARMKAKIKRRWPVPEILICYFSDNAYMQNSKGNVVNQELFNANISDLLKNQLNVEKYEVKPLVASFGIEKILAMIEAKLPIVPLVNLQKKRVAPKVKSDIGKLIQEFENLDKIELLKVLKASDKFRFNYGKESSFVDLSEEDLEISFSVLNGFVYSENENFIVFISSQRDQTLITKGLVRDLARNLQQLRKTKSYNPTEILSTAYVAKLDKDEISDLYKFKEELTFLVRVKSVLLTEEKISGVDYDDIEIGGRAISISVH